MIFCLPSLFQLHSSIKNYKSIHSASLLILFIILELKHLILTTDQKEIRFKFFSTLSISVMIDNARVET